ncbi:heme exporter protein CcmD, partial [Klebsiella variicola]|nr:heme exporter protein CcmD [Klebsiella variicola]
ARRALVHEVRRQQARERRIAAAREHDKEAADASAS